MIPQKPTFQHQVTLANYCRNGALENIPGVTKNISHYRRLVFNNVLDSLSAAYPLTEYLLEEEWEALVHRFFATHKVQSPQIWHMPKEIIDYVNCYEKELLNRYPFLPNLLVFEWLEIEVFMMPDVVFPKATAGKLFCNPEIQLVEFQFPVHLKKAFQITTSDEGTYFVAIYRNPDTKAVSFTNLSLLTYTLLKDYFVNPISREEIFNLIPKETSNEIKNQLTDFIEKCITNQLLINS